jgi:hypothetical protein
MKSERRHELQQNELDQELHQLLRWFRRNASRVIWGAILVIGIVVAVILWISNARQAEAALQTQFSQTAVFPEPELTHAEKIQKFQELAQTDDPRIAATAVLKMGNLYLMQTATSTSPMDAVKAGENAVHQFNRVIKEYSRFPSLVGAAYYGLAKEAEGREDWAQAREYYEKVTGMTELKGNPVIELSQGGLAGLPDLKDPVYLSDIKPTVALPMGPIKAVRTFFRAVEEEQDDKLEAMFAEKGAWAEAAGLVRNLPDGEPPSVLTSDVAETSAIVLTGPVRGEDDSLKPLVIQLVKKDDEWLISSVQLESEQQAREDVAAFREEFPKAKIDVEPMAELSLDTQLPEMDPNDAEEIDPDTVDANAIEPISPIEMDANIPE